MAPAGRSPAADNPRGSLQQILRPLLPSRSYWRAMTRAGRPRRAGSRPRAAGMRLS